MLPVCEFLEEPDLTEARNEFSLQTDRLSIEWLERFETLESVRRLDIFYWVSYSLSSFLVEYWDCWLLNLSAIFLFYFYIYLCLFLRTLFFVFT